MATGAQLPVTRQLGFVALIAADGSADKAWALATQVGPGRLRGSGHAMPLVRDPARAGQLVSEGRAAAERPAAGVAGREGRKQCNRAGATCASSCPAEADADAGRSRSL